MEIQLDHLYEFDLTGTISFGGLDESFLYDMFKDGRFCCEPLSRYLEQQFNDLVFVDKKGYDFTWQGRKIEKKQITKNGLKFCQSSMIGAGRVVNTNQMLDHISENKLLYLLADITEFPKVRVAFIEGAELVRHCKSKNFTYTRKAALNLLNAIKSKQEYTRQGSSVYTT